MSRASEYPALDTLKGTLVTTPLCRMVERAVLERPARPDFLFTSGRPGRYNPRAVEAIYAAEDQATAGAEAERYRKGRTTQTIVYWLIPNAHVLDLGDPANLTALGLTDADLFASWMFAAAPTRTQLLGQALASQSRFAGIRFPSDAAKARGFTGYNMVFLKAAVVAPSLIIIRDDTGHEIQKWP